MYYWPPARVPGGPPSHWQAGYGTYGAGIGYQSPTDGFTPASDDDGSSALLAPYDVGVSAISTAT